MKLILENSFQQLIAISEINHYICNSKKQCTLKLMQKSEFYKEFYKLPNENKIIYNHEVPHLELDKLVLKLTNRQSGITQQQIESLQKLTTKK